MRNDVSKLIEDIKEKIKKSNRLLNKMNKEGLPYLVTYEMYKELYELNIRSKRILKDLIKKKRLEDKTLT